MTPCVGRVDKLPEIKRSSLRKILPSRIAIDDGVIFCARGNHGSTTS
jgi:hypothetical protein